MINNWNQKSLVDIWTYGTVEITGANMPKTQNQRKDTA